MTLIIKTNERYIKLDPCTPFLNKDFQSASCWSGLVFLQLCENSYDSEQTLITY